MMIFQIAQRIASIKIIFFLILGWGYISVAQSSVAQSVDINQSGFQTSFSRNIVETLTLPINKSMVMELEYEASEIILTNPAIADAMVRTAKRIIFRGISIGQTNAVILDSSGQQILEIEILVEQDVASLERLMRKYLPNARIHIESANGTLILTGHVSNPSEAAQALSIAESYAVPGGSGSSSGSSGGNKLFGVLGGASEGGGGSAKIINLLTIEGKDQVLLKARFVEMQRSVTKQLGINLSGSASFGELTPARLVEVVSPTNGNIIEQNILPPEWSNSGSLSTTNAFSVAGRALGGLAGSIGYANQVGNVLQSSIGAALNALERVGISRTLAEPSVTAISGEAANFRAGGEFPVPVGQDQDTGEVSVEFKPYGVGLGVTPIVLSGGRISLKISTEVSDISNVGALDAQSVAGLDARGNVITVQTLAVPALTVRRVETVVETASGKSIVIGGLLQQKTAQAIDSIPGVKSAPILGALFRSRDFLNEETELVIIITPYLVDPANSNELRTPADGYMNAGDFSTVLLGKLNKVYGSPGSDIEGLSFDAPIGFIVE